MASLLGDGPATTAKVRFTRRSGARLVPAIALLGLTAGVLATTAGATADPAACRAPAPRHAVVADVRGMPCGEAVADLTSYYRTFAVSFRTPGGFTCARTLRLTNHDPENGIDATGSITALRISRGGAVDAAGRFVAGGTAAFRVVGDCR
jgi:hypothetical protein